MMITVFGGLSMLAGFLMLYVASHTFSIREIVANVEVIRDHTLFTPALILILLGALQNLHNFHSTFGCLMLWRPQHLLVLTYIPQQW